MTISDFAQALATFALKLTIQLFKDLFRHDSCHHQFNVFFRFPLFYIRLQFEYGYNLKFKNIVTVTILRVQVHEC